MFDAFFDIIISICIHTYGQVHIYIYIFIWVELGDVNIYICKYVTNCSKLFTST